MKGLFSLVISLFAFLAVADGAKPSAYAAASCKTMDMVGAADAWHWSHRAWINKDAALQDELRGVFAERFSDEWRTAQSCAGNWDNPKMKGLLAAFPEAFWLTPSGRTIVRYAETHGFCVDRHVDCEKLRLAVDEDGQHAFNVVLGIGGRAADVTLALRATLQKFRAGTNATEIAYDECCGTNAPSFHALGYEENGKGKLYCRYEKAPEPQCAWQAKTRELGRARTYAEVDGEKSWRLLARRPEEYTYEDVLKAFGKPKRSARLRCQNCDSTDMRWTYEIGDADKACKAIRHTLVFAFADDGRCVRWKWSAE